MSTVDYLVVKNVLLVCRVSDEVSRFVTTGESFHGSELPSTTSGTDGRVLRNVQLRSAPLSSKNCHCPSTVHGPSSGCENFLPTGKRAAPWRLLADVGVTVTA